MEGTENETRCEMAGYAGEDPMVQAIRTCGVHILSGQGSVLARHVCRRMVAPLRSSRAQIRERDERACL